VCSSDLPVSVPGEPGKPPLKPFGPQAYSTAGLFAANGILLALWGRHSSGRGEYLDIAIHECVAAALDHVMVRYFYEGVAASRKGSLYWNNAFKVFPCQDGYILLSLAQQWETLVEWLNSEGMAEDLTENKWLDEAEQQKNVQHIIDVLEKWTRSHTVKELVELGQLMRFPWASVDSIDQVVNNPQLKDRGFFVEARDPVSSQAYIFPGAPVKMGQSRWQVNPIIAPPGEYNREIYSRRLGLAESEIEELIRTGVI
jgi:crotonobetainyl-CoA:carnitine CoA-transferase CaiB-like acyl-CoA transferase